MKSNYERATVWACNNDEPIIERLKELKIWDQVKVQSIMGETVCFVLPGELFIWHGCPGDSGYSHFKCDDPCELVYLAGLAMAQSRDMEVRNKNIHQPTTRH